MDKVRIWTVLSLSMSSNDIYGISQCILVSLIVEMLGIVQEDCQQWRPMRRAFGAVFDFTNPPSGELYLRFQVSGSAGLYWVQSKNAIPSDWKGGAAYDTLVQLN